MPKHDPSDKAGKRKPAPHVQAAIAAGAQPKMPDTRPGARPMAPHVAAATGAVQPKTPATPPGARLMAPHVAAATGAMQPKALPGARLMAPHVAAATGAAPMPTGGAPIIQGYRPAVIQMKCGICGAKSHTTAKCPKQEKEEEKEEKGRGLTKASGKYCGWLDTCLEKLDSDDLYGSEQKSLVGGFKGKPNGLKQDDKEQRSARIDRQGEGNVQFQVSGKSYAKVTFKQTDDAKDIIKELKASCKDGKEHTV